jgi:hypothetical protein
MAARKRQNGKDRLEEAMALLIQNQASFLARISEMDRVNGERFARIEAELMTIRTILLHHEEILRSLPEAIREKVGYVPQK